MGDNSGIEWTDATWNPTTGCDRVSPGCANCYALTLAPRLQAMAKHRSPTDPYMKDGDPKTSGKGFGLMMHESKLDQPLRWSRPRRVFTNSMSDLFHPEVTDEFLDKVFAVMALAKQHTFQVLTKRPERMREYLHSAAPRVSDGAIRDREAVVWDALMNLPQRKHSPGYTDAWRWPLPNVWLGTSVENARWRTRIDYLRQTPAAVRFLSCEPLLGPLVPNPLGEGLDDLDLNGIDWAIIGGESGPGARPMDEQWVRDIVGSCRQQGVAPFVKQMGEVWSREHLGHGGHAGDIEQFPSDLRIREYPRVTTVAASVPEEALSLNLI